METGPKGRWIITEQTEFDHKAKKPARIAEPHYEGNPVPAFKVIEYQDPRLRPTLELHPGGKIVRFAYAGLSKTTSEDVFDRDTHGQTGPLLYTSSVDETKNALDQVVGRASEQENGNRYTVSYQYDISNRLVKTSDSMGITLMTADFGNRMDTNPLRTSDAGLGHAQMVYDSLGRLTEKRRDFKDTLDRVSTMVYDGLDRIIKQTDHVLGFQDERTIENEYDTAPNGINQLAFQKVIDKNNLGTYRYERRFEYDDHCLKSSVGHKWHVAWEVGGTSIEKDLEASTKYRHNGPKGGRLEKITLPEIHDPATGTKVGGESAEYIYDDASGLIEAIHFMGKTIWQVPDGKFTPQKKAESVKLGNGIETDLSYDTETGRLIGFETYHKDLSLFSYNLIYDSAGNVLAKTSSVAEATPAGSGLSTQEIRYKYDKMNQLIAAQGDDLSQAFAYGPNGSRTNLSDAEKEVQYQYDLSGPRPHQISAILGTEERLLSYDGSGNLIRDQKKSGDKWYTRQLTWNASNRLQLLEFLDENVQAARSLCFGYGPESLRIIKYDDWSKSIVFSVDTLADVEYRLDGEPDLPIVKHHVVNDGRRVATLTKPSDGQALVYFHRDLQSSIIMATNEDAKILAAPRYQPFGMVENLEEARVAKNLDILYTGHRADMLEVFGFSQFDFKARVYDPQIGIFLSPDENEDKSNAAFGLNRYVYVNNNPASMWDPTGYQGEDEDEEKAKGKNQLEEEEGFDPKFGFDFEFGGNQPTKFKASAFDSDFDFDDIMKGVNDTRGLFGEQFQPRNLQPLNPDMIDRAIREIERSRQQEIDALLPQKQNSSFNITPSFDTFHNFDRQDIRIDAPIIDDFRRQPLPRTFDQFLHSTPLFENSGSFNLFRPESSLNPMEQFSRRSMLDFLGAPRDRFGK